MTNIRDYLNYEGNIKINKDNINEVDILIFALLSYFDLKTIPLHPHNKKIILTEALKKIFKETKKEEINMGMIVPQQIVELAYKLKDLNRYQIECSNYINIINQDLHIQFSAVCFHVDDIVIVTYRGTDDSLIGWQENIDLITNFPTNGEKEATKYLNEIAKTYNKSKIIVVGHSKGGNLATYASICCDDYIKNKIIGSYDLDGPGFCGEFNETSYNLIKDKLHKYLPYESIIGMLLNEFCTDLNIIKCDKYGLFQHDGFTWNVKDSSLVRTNELSNISIKINKEITKSILKLNEKEKNDLANDFYLLIRKSNIKTLIEIKENHLELLKALITMNIKNRRFFVRLIITIFKYGGI